MRTLVRRSAIGLTAGALALVGLGTPGYADGASSAADLAGTVTAWGSDSQATTMPDLGNDVVSIAAGHGADYDLALHADGTVTGWGAESTPASLPTDLKNASTAHVTQLSAGPAYAVALRADGTIKQWGGAATGTVPTLSGVTQVLAAPLAAAAVNDGHVTEWGGTASFLPMPTGLSDVVQVASETMSMLALKSDGTIVTWGMNPAGPNSVPGDDLPASLQSRVQGNVTAIAASGSTSAALLKDGTVVAWSAGTAKTVPAALDGKVVDQLDVNGSIVAHTTDGEIVDWGGDASTQTVPSSLTGAPITRVVSGYTAHDLAIVTALRSTAAPVITGTPQVDRTLSVTPATFNLTPASVTTQWMADGEPIADAMGSSLALTDALLGKQITVVQTVTLGDQSVTTISDSTAAVAQFATTLKASVGRAIYGTPVRVSVAANSTAVTGVVQLKEGARLLGTANLAAGKAAVTLRGTALRAGRHTLNVSYAGDADHTAATTTLRVAVAKAAAKVKATVKPVKLTRANVKKAKATITVTTGGHTATGKVTVELRTKKVTVTLHNGKAVVALRKLVKAAKKGTNKVTVVYSGDVNTKAASTRVVLKIRK
jgi:hypothetical protein